MTPQAIRDGLDRRAFERARNATLALLDSIRDRVLEACPGVVNITDVALKLQLIEVELYPERFPDNLQSLSALTKISLLQLKRMERLHREILNMPPDTLLAPVAAVTTAIQGEGT